ncbi:uncharacterized protein ACA1_204580 [Acanthamoeba castellanii str. Neff]|uniref:Uncharacterized protein n=1 Tax=Acanthamoeba castellanii (strain ATCC 30010 / Neff) TaxID=1257118 RepID=L8GTM7_ACACF|nr:uncharacterized protein ACA1_204580 [Acanthamoeba castellanii str. Neff]ELR16370.1 hypothetical protein ACA1_204580 [Acanthamoeba castellanii str. Neff]
MLPLWVRSVLEPTISFVGMLTGAVNLIEHYKLSGLLKDRDKIPPTFEPYIRHLPVMGNETDKNPALGLRALFPLDEWPIVEDDDDLALAPLGQELLKGLTLEPGKLEERRRRKKHRDKDREGRAERKHRKHRKKHRDQQVAADGSVISPGADGGSAAPTPGTEPGAEGGERRDKERKHRHKHKRKSREEGAEGSTKESREERRKKRRRREQQAGSENQQQQQPSPTKPTDGAPAAPAVVG